MLLFFESDFLALMAADEALANAGATPHFVADAGQLEGAYGELRASDPRSPELVKIEAQAHRLKSEAAQVST